MNDKKKIEFIWNTLDRIERGQYVGVSIGTVTDMIAWLWKWRKIDYQTLTDMTGKATYVISTFKPD